MQQSNRLDLGVDFKRYDVINYRPAMNTEQFLMAESFPELPDFPDLPDEKNETTSFHDFPSETLISENLDHLITSPLLPTESDIFFQKEFDPAELPDFQSQPQTDFGESDSEDEDVIRFQDEGLREQLRITLQRKLNYEAGSSPQGVDYGTDSKLGTRLVLRDFKNLHQEVSTRLSNEVFHGIVDKDGKSLESNSLRRRSRILQIPIQPDEIGLNMGLRRRISNTYWHGQRKSTYMGRGSDSKTIMNEERLNRLDAVDVHQLIVESEKNKTSFFKIRRRTKEEAQNQNSSSFQARKKSGQLALFCMKIPSGAALNSDHFEIDESITQNRAEYVYSFYTPDITQRIRFDRIKRGDLIFVVECTAGNPATLIERSTIKHVMIVTDIFVDSVEVAHVTRSSSALSRIRDIYTRSAFYDRKRQSFQAMMHEAGLAPPAVSYLGVVVSLSSVHNNITEEAAHTAHQIIMSGRIIPSSTSTKRTCLADANNNESFLLKNKNASFFRRTVRDIWDKSDGFLNLYPEDLVALCYHRAIVKSTKTFAKEVVRILDVDWRAMNIHDLFNYCDESEDWQTTGEIFFEFG